MTASFRSKTLFAALALSGAIGAQAQQKTFYVAGYGGSFEQTMRKEIIPAFEKKHGVKVEYVAGNSTDTLAKLQAQKGNQQIDVVIVDDGPMYQAISLGFCAPIKGLPAADIYDSAKYKDDMAVGIGLVGTGIMYNTKVFKEKGWAPPTSWNDLKDPKFKKLLVIPPINNSYGLYTLVMFAPHERRRREEHRAGLQGDEGADQPERAGLRAVAGQDDRALPERPGRHRRLGHGPRAVLRRSPASRSTSSIRRKARSTLLASACPVAKPDASPLAQEFVKALRRAAVPAGAGARDTATARSTRRPRSTTRSCTIAPIGDRAAKLVNIDWDTVNEKRDDWTKRWNREIER